MREYERLRGFKIWKRYVKQRSNNQILGDFGEKIFAQEVSWKLKWIDIEHPKLDEAGIDRLFMLEEALLLAQIRTSTLGENQSWNFGGSTRPLNPRLYNSRLFYLVLIGFDCTEEQFFDKDSAILIPLSIRHALDPIIRRGATEIKPIERYTWMIKGTKVLEHLKGRKTTSITICKQAYEKSKYKWLEGTRDIAKIFTEEYEQQTSKETKKPFNPHT